MESKKRAGGRPSIPWNAQRKRKLVRLYMMTDLKLEEIRQILVEDNFAPAKRNIQTHLRFLLPDHGPEWRRYRPNGDRRARERLITMRISREYHISKSMQRYSRWKEISETSGPPAMDTEKLQNANALHDPPGQYDTIECTIGYSVDWAPVKSVLALSTRSSQIESAKSSSVAWSKSHHSSWQLTESEPGRILDETTPRSTPSNLNSGNMCVVDWIESDTMKTLILEAEIESPPLSLSRLSRVHMGSLHQRPCCDFSLFKNSVESCHICGNNQNIYQARQRTWPFEELPSRSVFLSAHDKFGNTMLHHAATAGNLLSVRSWQAAIRQCMLADLTHRNTSGETFLHVLHVPHVEHLNFCLTILEAVAKRGFDLSIRDYSGNTIVRRIHELIQQWVDVKDELPVSFIIEAARILEVPECFLTSPSYGGPAISCDTPLFSTLRNWRSTTVIEAEELEFITRSSDIDMRDKRGHTALAIASGLGIPNIVQHLLATGANPNTRSYRGTNVISHATSQYFDAQKNGDSGLYGRILSCIGFLTDHGAKTTVDDYGEFYISTPKPLEKQVIKKSSKPLLKSTSSKKYSRKRPLGVVHEESAHSSLPVDSLRGVPTLLPRLLGSEGKSLSAELIQTASMSAPPPVNNLADTSQIGHDYQAIIFLTSETMLEASTDRPKKRARQNEIESVQLLPATFHPTTEVDITIIGRDNDAIATPHIPSFNDHPPPFTDTMSASFNSIQTYVPVNSSDDPSVFLNLEPQYLQTDFEVTRAAGYFYDTEMTTQYPNPGETFAPSPNSTFFTMNSTSETNLIAPRCWNMNSNESHTGMFFEFGDRPNNALTSTMDYGETIFGSSNAPFSQLDPAATTDLFDPLVLPFPKEFQFGSIEENMYDADK
ncbi:hypothetical protein B0J14DRAFT_22315 [Halenospora varia]|nr:hypothetical protein B0J14DRAFT_22315 [Halenospora varia]